MTTNVYDLYRVGSDGETLEGFKVNHSSVSDFNDAVINQVGANNIARTALAQSLLGKNTAADMRELINARENKPLTSSDINDLSSTINTAITNALAAIAPVRKTADEFTNDNPILNVGQIGYETDTNFIKIGDGTTAYNSLDYVKSNGMKIDNNLAVELTDDSGTEDVYAVEEVAGISFIADN